MKFLNLVLLMTLMVTLLGCSKDTHDLDSTKIEGKWQLIGKNLGLPDGYQNVTDGDEISLNHDLSFVKPYGKCSEGTYTVSKDYIIFDYSCKGKETMLSQGVEKWRYSLKDGILSMSPTFLNCDEGCSYFYKKISD